MTKFGQSQTVRRVEDVRFLTGQGRYIDDTAPRDALHALFLRSPHAHAVIRSIDVSDARDMPGVAGVYTIADLDRAGIGPLPADVMKGGAEPPRPVLARGRVRFVGEAVALVVARTLAEARDAAEAIAVDYAEEPAKVDLAPGGTQVHPEAPANVAFRWSVGSRADTDRAFARAAHRVGLRVVHNRVIANPMEPRGAWAEWVDGRLHFHFSGQGVWEPKKDLAKILGLPADRLRVATPDVGGGFGMKAMQYPEYAAISHAARDTGRPVRWIAERTEGMLTDNAGRDLVADVEMAFDGDHRILGYRVHILSNLGAYNSGFAQHIQSELFAKVLTGAYDIRAAHMVCEGIYTHTTQTDAYRGAGRPEAIMTLERLMDAAARQLGANPWELRRKNFVTTFPYRSVTGSTYDVGDFPRVLARAKAEADAAGFPARRQKAANSGQLRGMGVCYYIESILGDKDEGAAVVFADDGMVDLQVGTQSNGQGHETVYAQFLSDRTGIPIERIRIVQGDSDVIRKGGGTGGSRSVTVQSNATLQTVDKMIAAFAPFVAGELGVPGPEVRWEDNAFRAKGSNRVMSLLDAAEHARAAGRRDLLRHFARATLPARSFPNGCHVAEVEVDPETGQVRVVRYTVTDDFGNMMHPTLVEGQIHGGVAQGIGQALFENAVYDDTGQLLAATFMDYGMPRAADVPAIVFATEPTPSTTNVFGMKGCGEAGTVGALAAVSNALLDALAPMGVTDVDMPFTPERVWSWLREARIAGQVKGAAAR